MTTIYEMRKQLVGTVMVISMMLLAFWTSYTNYASRGLVFKSTVQVDKDTNFALDNYKENLFTSTVLYNNTFYKSVVQYIHGQSLVEKCSNRRYIIYRCNPGMLCRGIGDR
ncbi:hypothetical protein MAR_004755, partial [Mya arenaria]